MGRQKSSSLSKQMEMAKPSVASDSSKQSGLRSKEVLAWADKVGMEGIDNEKLRDRLAKERRTDESLAKCSETSLIQCYMSAAALGLTFGKEFGQAYPVAFWDSKSRGFKAQLIVGYRGWMLMADRDADCKVTAQAIYENDDFGIDLSDPSKMHHRPPLSSPRGEVIGARAQGEFSDGRRVVEFMNMEELHKIRESSNGYRSAASKGYSHPWMTWVSEMARKSAVKRMCKMIPCGGLMDAAPMLDGQVADHRGSFNPELDVIHGDAEVVDDKGGSEQPAASQKDAAF